MLTDTQGLTILEVKSRRRGAKRIYLLFPAILFSFPHMPAVKTAQTLKWDGLWRKPESPSTQPESRGGLEPNGAEITRLFSSSYWGHRIKHYTGPGANCNSAATLHPLQCLFSCIFFCLCLVQDMGIWDPGQLSLSQKGQNYLNTPG